MKKKAQGISFNSIVLAVIALVALVVIIAIFSNTSGKTAQNINSCVTKGGVCADDPKSGENGKCGGEYPVPIFISKDCENVKNLCCLKVGS